MTLKKMTLHNDIHHNDPLHNDIHHNDNDTQTLSSKDLKKHIRSHFDHKILFFTFSTVFKNYF
jgi:hypothetical protein